MYISNQRFTEVPYLYVPYLYVPYLYVPYLYVPYLYVPYLYVPYLYVPYLYVSLCALPTKQELLRVSACALKNNDGHQVIIHYFIKH